MDTLIAYQKVLNQRLAMNANIIRRFPPELVQKVNGFLRELIQKNDFSMCVPSKYLPDIIKDNEIKSMVQTGHGTSNGGVGVRKEWMKRVFGCMPEKAEEFPKFGLLTSKNLMRDLGYDPDPFYHYGSILLTFKKENIMNRTFMTVGSSFDIEESWLKSPVPVTSPDLICIKGYPHAMMPVPPNKRYFIGALFFYDMIMRNKINTDLPNHLCSASENMLGFEDYELQIFGKLTFSEDVESVHYFTLDEKDEEIVKQVAPELARLGIPFNDIMPSF